MRSRSLRLLRLATLIVTGGVCLQIGSCSLGTITHFVGNLNPCGSILNCDPVTYRFITSGYSPPGADPAIDPACTFPPFCVGDPFVATVAP